MINSSFDQVGGASIAGSLSLSLAFLPSLASTLSLSRQGARAEANDTNPPVIVEQLTT